MEHLMNKVTTKIMKADSDSEDDFDVAIEHTLTRDVTVFNTPNYMELSDKETDETPTYETESLYPNKMWINCKPLSRFATTYELQKFEKNCLIIFNQINIIGYEPRLGSDKDVKSLEDTFKRFGFETKEYPDLTKNQIFDVLNTCKLSLSVVRRRLFIKEVAYDLLPKTST